MLDQLQRNHLQAHALQLLLLDDDVLSGYARPVPAGIKRPTTTFSFKPRKSSSLPVTAASVNTRVVSWNDAAEMNESVESDALVIPIN